MKLLILTRDGSRDPGPGGGGLSLHLAQDPLEVTFRLPLRHQADVDVCQMWLITPRVARKCPEREPAYLFPIKDEVAGLPARVRRLVAPPGAQNIRVDDFVWMNRADHFRVEVGIPKHDTLQRKSWLQDNARRIAGRWSR